MIERIVVAVDDSPAGLAAARQAISLAATLGASVRAIHVLVNGELELALAALHDRDVDAVHRSRGESSIAVLRHATEIGRRAGVDIETAARLGEVARSILDESTEWGADLIVVGRSDRVGPRQPYVGSETREVLEFSEVPVLVVPVP